MRTDYDDSGWSTCQMPKNHGTERHEGEALLLRKWVKADDFARTRELHIDRMTDDYYFFDYQVKKR